MHRRRRGTKASRDLPRPPGRPGASAQPGHLVVRRPRDHRLWPSIGLPGASQPSNLGLLRQLYVTVRRHGLDRDPCPGARRTRSNGCWRPSSDGRACDVGVERQERRVDPVVAEVDAGEAGGLRSRSPDLVRRNSPRRPTPTADAGSAATSASACRGFAATCSAKLNRPPGRRTGGPRRGRRAGSLTRAQDQAGDDGIGAGVGQVDPFADDTADLEVDATPARRTP